MDNQLVFDLFSNTNAAAQILNRDKMCIRDSGNTDHNIAGLSGDALKDAVLMERKLELFGEGHTRYDMVRSAKFSEEAVEVRNEMEAVSYTHLDVYKRQCIFVDHGMLRKNEFKNVLHDYECLGLNVIGVDASAKFFAELAGVTAVSYTHLSVLNIRCMAKR